MIKTYLIIYFLCFIKKDILDFYLEDVIFEEVVKEEILIEIVLYKDKHYSIDILKPSRYDYINHYVKGKLHKIINRVKNNNTKYKQIYSRIFFDIEVPIKKKNIYPNYSDSSSMGTKSQKGKTLHLMDFKQVQFITL